MIARVIAWWHRRNRAEVIVHNHTNRRLMYTIRGRRRQIEITIEEDDE